jgi:membrane-associated protease RseP (regulator of RpoE activity)
MQSAPARPAQRPWLHLALFVLTVGTTTFTYQQTFSGPGGPAAEQWGQALAFSAALLSILGAHEMGHWLLARWHQVDASLPYFIPLPYVGVGTLGAVIRIRDRIPHRNALVDIGAAGPLAGLAVAVPLLWWGLERSTVVQAHWAPQPFPGEMSLWTLGHELWQWAQVRLGLAPSEPLPAPALLRGYSWVFGDNLLMLGLQRLVLGPLQPGTDVVVHPVVIAAWFGLLVTLLNLLPVGQFDGGHLAFALLGRRARRVGQVAALVLFLLTLFYTVTWGLWLLVATKVVGFDHPDVTAPEQPLGRGRVLVCALCLLALIGCAMPVPIRVVTW